MVGYAKRKELAEGLRGLFAAPSREVALRLASELAARWRGSHPKVAEHPKSTSRVPLLPATFPESHRRRIRTTNGLERLNQEILQGVKRRTSPKDTLPVRPGQSEGLGLTTWLAEERLARGGC